MNEGWKLSKSGHPTPSFLRLISPGPMSAVIFWFHVVVLGFMIEQMPVCTQANEVAE